MPVLSLDQDVLNKLNIRAIAEEVSDYGAEEDNLPQDKEEIQTLLDAELLQLPGFHWWVRTSLSYCPQKLSTLREANSIVTILQFRVIRHHFTHFAHLSVGILEETALDVHNDVAANHDAVDIDTRYFILQIVLLIKNIEILENIEMC